MPIMSVQAPQPSFFPEVASAVGQSTTFTFTLTPTAFSCSPMVTAVSLWFLKLESVRITSSSPL